MVPGPFMAAVVVEDDETRMFMEEVLDHDWNVNLEVVVALMETVAPACKKGDAEVVVEPEVTPVPLQLIFPLAEELTTNVTWYIGEYTADITQDEEAVTFPEYDDKTQPLVDCQTYSSFPFEPLSVRVQTNE